MSDKGIILPTIIVPKAQPTGEGATPDTYIYIIGELPELKESFELAEWDRYMDDHARRLERVLATSLPGSIYDRLLRGMLDRKASHFRVAHLVEESEPPQEGDE